MGNCLLLLGVKRHRRPVKLLILGLDNAGKTTTAKGIVGDPVESTVPTIGFSPEKLEYRGCEITMYDLGGSQGIRKVWSNYFSDVHGLIFVVDSSDHERIEECRGVLNRLISDKSISGKPILVLANKQDIEGALDEIDLVEALRMEDIVNNFKCPTRLETCSASVIHERKPDKHIADGFRWLIDTIVVHYEVLDKRVIQDKEEIEQRLAVDAKYIRESLKEPLKIDQAKKIEDTISRTERYDTKECASYDQSPKINGNGKTSQQSVYHFHNKVMPTISHKELKSLTAKCGSQGNTRSSSDCIPINPDDETFIVDVHSDQDNEGLQMHSAMGSIFSKGCTVTALNDHIELEATSERKSSRKHFLWIMQKTATVGPDSGFN